MEKYREQLKNKKRIVVKIGSSSLMHEETGRLDLLKMERLVRVLVDIKNSGKDVILVSSGAIAVGRNTLGLVERPEDLSVKQACAAIGQAKLMMVYQKIFSEYNTIAAQILMTKNTITNQVSRTNAKNTFDELLKLGVIPVVNENDTVASITGADLLILLSDIDGMYTDDPNKNHDARFISIVEKIDDKLMNMGKDSSGSGVGTGGMAAKIVAAQIANYSGADMVITNGNDVLNIHRIIAGEDVGTLFLQHENRDIDVLSLV